MGLVPPSSPISTGRRRESAPHPRECPTPLVPSRHGSPTHRLLVHRLRHARPPMGGEVPGVRRVEHAGRRGRAGARGRRGRRRSRAAVADHAGRPDAMEAPADGRQRARPCVGRRARRWFGHARRRRARGWQVHIALAGRGLGRTQRCAVSLHVGRGVGRAGAGPRCTRRRAGRRAVVLRRERRQGHRRVDRLGRSRLRGRRLGADDARLRARHHARHSEPGARLRAAAHRGHETPPDRDCARRPRHEGERDRRPAGVSSTRSTPCSRSAATGTTRCGFCARSSTASARPTSSACSRWASRA